MKKNHLISYICILISCCFVQFASADYFASGAAYKVYFTPQNDCTAQVVQAVNQAKNSLYVQAYFLTSEPIISALLDAKSRAVNVQVILDKNHKENQKGIQVMKQANIPIWIDQASGIAHNKVMVIDDRMVITGSFNFTYSANYRNRENILFINDPGLSKHYLMNWRRCQLRALQEKPLKSTNRKKQKLTQVARHNLFIQLLGVAATVGLMAVIVNEMG